MLFETIQNTIKTLDTSGISEERKEVLALLTTYVQERVEKDLPINLNFICTHNSRRSHLSQVWAQALAMHFDIPNVLCYSGGTEATAMFHMAAKTLAKQGFEIKAISEGDNPIQAIKYSENTHPIIGFSKTFDDAFNPQASFAAIMTCSSADAGCPFVPGCDKRIALTFEDPKAFDNTPQQAEKYEERSLQIASELFYAFSKAKK